MQGSGSIDVGVVRKILRILATEGDQNARSLVQKAHLSYSTVSKYILFLQEELRRG